MGLFTRITRRNALSTKQYVEMLENAFEISPRAVMCVVRIQWSRIWIDYHETHITKLSKRILKDSKVLYDEAREVVVDRMAEKFAEDVEEELIKQTD